MAFATLYNDTLQSFIFCMQIFFHHFDINLSSQYLVYQSRFLYFPCCVCWVHWSLIISGPDLDSIARWDVCGTWEKSTPSNCTSVDIVPAVFSASDTFGPFFLLQATYELKPCAAVSRTSHSQHCFHQLLRSTVHHRRLLAARFTSSRIPRLSKERHGPAVRRHRRTRLVQVLL